MSHLFHFSPNQNQRKKTKFLLLMCRFLLGNCQTFHLSSSTDCTPLSLSPSHRPWQRDPSASSRFSLFSYSISSVNSLFLFFLNIKFIFGLCSICVWVMGKQWKRGTKVKFISGFFVFSCFYVWIFPLVAVACFLISVWKS